MSVISIDERVLIAVADLICPSQLLAAIMDQLTWPMYTTSSAHSLSLTPVSILSGSPVETFEISRTFFEFSPRSTSFQQRRGGGEERKKKKNLYRQNERKIESEGESMRELSNKNSAVVWRPQSTHTQLHTHTPSASLSQLHLSVCPLVHLSAFFLHILSFCLSVSIQPCSIILLVLHSQ